ncbi:MAG: CHAT domain-containing protein, partial [Burkholderiaceae bacterium]|nr:CHAT domain-containing protein [Burkholderiaceae bacterium]
MTRALVELVGEDIRLAVAGGPEQRLDYAASKERLEAWAKRYDLAISREERQGDLLSIGQEMFDWLDDTGWASAWVNGSGDRELEIQAADNPRAAPLLKAPWELLARKTETGPLSFDPNRLFIVARRIGQPAPPWRPRYRDIQLMFMAAAPKGQANLDFEAEEASVLEATRTLGRVHLVVEETGAREFLRARLLEGEPFEALHLSCHGDIDPQQGPVLLLETPEGGCDLVTPGELIEALGPQPVPLVVLSACRTAERHDGAGG